MVDGNTVQLLKESGAPGLADDVYKVGDNTRPCVFGQETRQKDLYASTVESMVHEFCDGINTGFYINSYTTKQCPTMEGVLEEMRRGLERLQEQH